MSTRSQPFFPPPRRPLHTPLYVRLFYRLLRWLMGVLFTLEVKRANLIPENGPFILAANHLSRFDPLLLLIILPLRPRIWFLAAAMHTVAIPWRRWLLATMGGIIPVHEGNPRSGQRALRDARYVLKSGGRVGIFPEGRVGPAEGMLLPVRPGTALLSLRTRVPVLPVWIAGSRRVYWKKRIQIVVGEPFYPPAGVSTADACASVSGALMECRQHVEVMVDPPNPRGQWINKLL